MSSDYTGQRWSTKGRISNPVNYISFLFAVLSSSRECVGYLRRVEMTEIQTEGPRVCCIASCGRSSRRHLCYAFLHFKPVCRFGVAESEVSSLVVPKFGYQFNQYSYPSF